MESNEIDEKIELAERKVLLAQSRIIERKEEANQLLKRLERESNGLEEIKKEWIRKKNLEEERIRLEFKELKQAHRNVIEDLRLKYERERENKLREVKSLISEEEREIRELQKKKADAIMKTKSEEAQIKARYQVKINALLRDEQAASRKGVVKQKRLLEAPNVFTMTLERNQPSGMKKKAIYRRQL